MVELVVPADGANFNTRYGLSRATRTGRFIFTGAMALDSEKMVRMVEADTVAAEVRICLDQINATLSGQGKTLSDIAKLTLYLSEIVYQEEAETALAAYFGPGSTPLCLTVGAGLACGCRVEIEAVALEV
jgi:2-iminobutanoate/2-iminopropanoate deaminase